MPCDWFQLCWFIQIMHKVIFSITFIIKMYGGNYEFEIDMNTYYVASLNVYYYYYYYYLYYCDYYVILFFIFMIKNKIQVLQTVRTWYTS